MLCIGANHLFILELNEKDPNAIDSRIFVKILGE